MTSKVKDDAGINTSVYKKNPYVNNFANKSLTQSDLANATMEKSDHESSMHNLSKREEIGDPYFRSLFQKSQ